jgi:serine protease Do
VVERIAGAITVGAPLYNKGDQAGCRDLYRRVARALRDELIPAGRCPAARAELDAALTAAAQASDVSDAAWALRRGFDRITERWQDPR